MTGHHDDIRRYIRLTDNTRSETDNILLEGIQIHTPDPSNLLLEDMSDMIFKFRSYSERDGSEDYSRGVEEGLSLAAQMLERLLERYSGHSKEL